MAIHTSGETFTLWCDELKAIREAPFPPGALLVAYFSPAEVVQFLRLGWNPNQYRWVDLFAEFRCLTNADVRRTGASLLDALAYFGFDGLGASHKDEMRDLAIRGGPFTDAEKLELVVYCRSDVQALVRLWDAMAHRLDIGRALLRGRYQVAVGRMELAGVPIDQESLADLQRHWTEIRHRLISDVDQDYGVFDNGVFKRERFRGYLQQQGIGWPTLASGMLDLKDATFRDMSIQHPELEPLRQLREGLSQMSRIGITVDADGRSRTMLSPFRSKSGRNQPSTSRFIFGAAAWLRSLIKPKPGRAVFYVDFCQQEFGIAAALSGDSAMAEAYRSGDPYLAFARQSGAVPENATKKSHPNERKLFKQCVLAVQYGQGAESFARKIGVTVNEAQRLLRLHRETYRTFWAWSDRVVTYAMLHGVLFTRFNWRMQIGPAAREPSLRNFPMQANGAEMLRLACILGTESGIRICAPVHDAVLVECGIDEVDECVDQMRECMRVASEVVCPGFPLDTDVEVVRYPNRYEDERGGRMWRQVSDLMLSVKEGHHAIAS